MTFLQNDFVVRLLIYSELSPSSFHFFFFFFFGFSGVLCLMQLISLKCLYYNLTAIFKVAHSSHYSEHLCF
jgi:hypothetical protein